MLVTNTKELGSILGAIHQAQDMLGGATNIPNAIEKALLALKHRSNKNLRQRIVVFVGSPLEGQAAARLRRRQGPRVRVPFDLDGGLDGCGQVSMCRAGARRRSWGRRRERGRRGGRQRVGRKRVDAKKDG